MMATYASMSAGGGGGGDDKNSDTNPPSPPRAATVAAAASADEQPPPAAVSFDLGAKLSQRLREHTAHRERTKRRLDQENAQLQRLLGAAPKRPRETKAALQQKSKKLERDRTTRSLPLAKEKELIRQMAAIEKMVREIDRSEKYQVLVRKKKAEVEASREEMRGLNGTISEIEKTLARVELGKTLGCLPSEVVVREIDCPMNMINWVLGKDGSNVKGIEDAGGVKITVDKIRGKVQVRGNAKAADEAILQLENFTKAVDEEMKASSDLITYLLSKESAIINKIKAENPEVRIDVLPKAIMMRGHPEKVLKAKGDIAGVEVASQKRVLTLRETSLVVGKTEGTIESFSEKYSVIMEISKDGADKSSLRIIGPSKNVDAAMAEVVKLLFDHDEVEESIVSDPLLKTELLNNSGAKIKEFQQSVSAALAAHHPKAGGVLLTFDRKGAKDGNPKLILKCSRCAMGRAKSMVTKKIQEFESNIISINVSEELVPAIIGKGGGTINELRNEGKGALVEADPKQGVVKVYSNDAATREGVAARVKQIVAENQVGYVPIEKASIGLVLGDPGKEVRNACAEIGCTFNVNKSDTELVIKGTIEHIEQASNLLEEFLAKNHIVELDIGKDDEPLLFLGGSDSVLHKVEAKHDVKATFRKGKHVLQVRGKSDEARAAVEDVKRFLNGGDGLAVCKFNVPEQAIGGVVGKGGSNIAKLETEFEGVLVYIPRDNSTISIRGPEDLVKQCRTRIITTIATTRVSDTIAISPQQHEELTNSDLIKRISRFTHAQIILNETFIKMIGIADDVRDAKANIDEHLTGKYHSYVDLEGSQFGRVEKTIESDPAHLERIQMSTGANVALEASACSIHISGKKSSVKKAKSSVMDFLSFMLPRQLQTVKIHRSLFKPMGDPGRLAEIAAGTGASITLDRDLSSLLIRSDDPSDCDKAVVLIKEMMAECEKLNGVIRFKPLEAWILPVVIGKGGASIKLLQKETECSFEILKDEIAVVISGETEEVFQAGKEALEKVIDQARKECVFLDLPESCMAAFIGKGGTGIQKMAADNDVQIERTKKRPNTIKITGKQECVACAQKAVSSWLEHWEASNVGTRLDFEEHLIPLILGKGGETIRSIQKETRCKIDVDRQNLFLTVRSGSDANREVAINKIKAIIDEEKAKAADRALAKAKLQQEQEVYDVAKPENTTQATSIASKPEKILNEAIGGSKNRSGEFAKVPVGYAPITNNGKNGSDWATRAKEAASKTGVANGEAKSSTELENIGKIQALPVKEVASDTCVANGEAKSTSELENISKVQALLLEARSCLEMVPENGNKREKAQDSLEVGPSAHGKEKARKLVEAAQEHMKKLLQDLK